MALDLPIEGEQNWDDKLNTALNDLDTRVTAAEAGVELPLSQTETHANPDTDSSDIAIHHTLGAGADQAAKGDHAHTLDSLSDVSTAGGLDGYSLVKQGSSFALADVAGGGVSTDHGALIGLGDDDHAQYHNDARGDLRYYTQAAADALLGDKADAEHTHSTDDLTTGTLVIDRLPAGSTIVNAHTGAAYPNRPTARTDITVIWRGPTQPAIGGVGAVAGVDVNWLTP